MRIDPTFSHANWISRGRREPRGYAAVVGGLGNLYNGGSFIFVGNVFANYDEGMRSKVRLNRMA